MSTRKKPRVVYMGTPDFAVPALEALYKEKYDIAAVITAPDKPASYRDWETDRKSVV